MSRNFSNRILWSCLFQIYSQDLGLNWKNSSFNRHLYIDQTFLVLEIIRLCFQWDYIVKLLSDSVVRKSNFTYYHSCNNFFSDWLSVWWRQRSIYQGLTCKKCIKNYLICKQAKNDKGGRIEPWMSFADPWCRQCIARISIWLIDD